MAEIILQIGDCRKLMKELKDEGIDLIIADYPFKTKNYLDFVRETADEFYRILKMSGNLVVINNPANFYKTLHYFNSKFKFRSGVPLIRMNSFKSFGRQLAFQHNYLMFLYKENSNKWYSPNGFSDVWHDILYKTGYRTIGNIFHPDSIPEELVSRCIQLTSIKGDWVLDPFAGAGTVGKVCQDLDRNCIMFEIDEKWKSVIKQRCKLNYKKLEENGQHYIKIASERIFKNSKAIEEFDNDEEKNVSKQ